MRVDLLGRIAKTPESSHLACVCHPDHIVAQTERLARARWTVVRAEHWTGDGDGLGCRLICQLTPVPS